MNGKDMTLVTVLAVAIVIVSVAIVVTTLPGNDRVPDTGTGSDPQPFEPGPIYPEGVRFNQDTGELTSESIVNWSITDLLVQYVDRVIVEVEGDSCVLNEGFYEVTVNGESFHVVVDGIKERSLDWEYLYNGNKVDVHVDYEISISELARIMIENGEWNASATHRFIDLPRGVYVNDTIRSVVSQLEDIYVSIGGDPDDRQSYADLLVSCAQLGIKYPNKVNGSTDYKVWGCDEYWANSLETLFFGYGDCDDSAVVACALFKAAGFKTAVVGIPGHVVAGLALDGFEERTLSDYKSVVSVYSALKVGCGYDVTGVDTETLYYGVETTKGQVPVGYLLSGSVNSLDKPTISWGMAGFYPVKD